jgi:hypothetical protein
VDADSILKGLKSVTKKWTRQRTKEVRSARAASRRPYMYSARNTATEILHEVLPPAYEKVSDAGNLPAHARQIMYECRDDIQEHTGNPLNDKYFTQTLLPDFQIAYPDLTSGWDVVYDARGTYREPHTRVAVPLGTLQVRCYLRGESGKVGHQAVRAHGLFPTVLNVNRFGAVLFIEKEGFLPLFHRVRLAERYDLAVMSTKGVSVTAARALVDELCGARKVPLVVVRDFDKTGFSIRATLTRSSKRYRFHNRVEAIDLGLRMNHVTDLKDEDSFIDPKISRAKLRANLRRNGAREEEIEFLIGRGRRVELNAFTSRGLVDWLEARLEAEGVRKVIPGPQVLEEAYRLAFVRESALQAARDARRLAEKEAAGLAVPPDLQSALNAALEKYPHLPWDRALARFVKNRLFPKPTDQGE